MVPEEGKTKRAIKVTIIIGVTALIVTFGIFTAAYNYVVSRDGSITIHETGLPANTTWKASLYSSTSNFPYSKTVVSNESNLTFNRLEANLLYECVLYWTAGCLPFYSSSLFISPSGPLSALFSSFSGVYYLKSARSLIETPVHKVVNLTFAPARNLTATNRIDVNGTIYYDTNGAIFNRLNISEFQAAFYPSDLYIQLNESPYNYSAYVQLFHNFTVSSVYVTSNVSGFSLLSITPQLPYYVQNANYSTNIEFNLSLRVPDHLTIASIYITFNITGWSP